MSPPASTMKVSTRLDLGAEPAALSLIVSRIADGDLSQRLGAMKGDASSVRANLLRMQNSLSDVVMN